MAQAGIEVAFKPCKTLSNIFPKPKDKIDFSQNSGLVYEIPCRDCDSVYIGETGRSISTRKKEHVDAVKNSVVKKSALCQHALESDHLIDWPNSKILKKESNIHRRRTAESFFINQRALSVNVLNRNDGLSLPAVYKALLQ